MQISTLAKPALPQRVGRYPKHPYKTVQKPWQIQPIMCAPVLAGETIQNILIQSRVVTDPILDPIGGWWLEYGFYYVKLQDLDARADLIEMLIDPTNLDVSALKLGAIETWSHTAEGGIPWAKLCLKRVVEEFYRDQGETWNTAAIDSVPLCHVFETKSNWAQSLVLSDTLAAEDVSLSTAGDNAFTMSEWEEAFRTYQTQKMHGLTNQTWEAYLQAQGVNVALAEEAHRPEELRHVRLWQYPSNTIDPTNGTPRSAVSWVVTERADKARFCPEPGFILGVQIARPKVFLRNQVGSAAGFMANSAMWMPSANADDPWASLQKHIVASGSGPVPAIADAEGYVWDMKDLLLYGEQFTNFDPAAVTGRNLVDLPTASGVQSYVDEDDINSIFVSGTSDLIKADGIVQLNISGRIRDTTPQPALTA